jgi:thiamine-monophosphate kinase
MADKHGQTRALSEDTLIARYFRPLAAAFPGAYDLRDDAATITPPEGADLVITTDALIADVHFFADDAPANIAYKALAVNVSDLAAKAATPIAYSLALALPHGTSEDWLRAFAKGLSEAQTQFDIALSGGDTTVSPSGPLMVAVTAFGTVPRDTMIRRATGDPGNALYVSGTIGDAALGLKLRRGDAFAALQDEARNALLARYLRPSPRLALRNALRAHASAAMDISDGLVIDCERLCAASNVGGVIETAEVPFSRAVASLIASERKLLETAITGGDDYEILAAIRTGEEGAFEQAATACGVGVTRIGVLTEGTGQLRILADGVPLKLAQSGYDHFQL